MIWRIAAREHEVALHHYCWVSTILRKPGFRKAAGAISITGIIISDNRSSVRTFLRTLKDGPRRLRRADGASTMPRCRKFRVPNILQLKWLVGQNG